nr:hypothetical protein [Tanacetum cinerariifolium]
MRGGGGGEGGKGGDGVSRVGDREADFVMGECMAGASSSLEMLTKSYIGYEDDKKNGDDGFLILKERIKEPSPRVTPILLAASQKPRTCNCQKWRRRYHVAAPYWPAASDVLAMWQVNGWSTVGQSPVKGGLTAVNHRQTTSQRWSIDRSGSGHGSCRVELPRGLLKEGNVAWIILSIPKHQAESI